MLGTTLGVESYLERLHEELQRVNANEIRSMSDLILDVYDRGGTVFICGNGGSGSNASHFCEDLGKGTLARADFDDPNKKRLRVLSLTDNTPYILAWANDEGFERVFVEQLKNLARPGDALICISGSGNSPNVLRAVEWSQANGLKTFGLTGFDGGLLRTMIDGGIHVALNDMGMVESIHLAVFHWVLDDLFAKISGPPD